MITYKATSWHARLYKSTYGTYILPKNICNYFWKLIVAILVAIPSWPGHLINFFERGFYPMKAIVSAIHVPVAIILGASFWKSKLSFVSFFSDYFTGLVIIILLIGAGALLILITFYLGVLIEKLKKLIYIKRTATHRQKNESVLVSGFKAVKNKYCSKIDWK